MNKVYIVEEGEDHEGGSIIGVFSTVEKARECAKQKRDSFHRDWKTINEDFWHVGCDWLTVCEHEVQ